MKRIIILLLLIFVMFQASAQTKGLIYKPANAGKSVLDPNLDGYVSETDQGFMVDDETESEIPYVPLPVVGAGEPSSDNSAGPSCGFVDLVRSEDDETIYTYSDGTNLFFRFRLGGTAENSKGYTILVDTDQLFGNGSDPHYVSGNPGFEYEITLRTNFGVSIYDINNNTLTSTEIGDGTVDRPYADFAQKAIAGSEICGTDYFYDFYVPYADLPFSSSTPVRMVGGTTIAPKNSTGFKMADLGGIDDALGVTDDLFQDLIDVFPPTSGDDISGGTKINPRAACPLIDGPIGVGVTSISGTTAEVDGATIEVFRGGLSQGTTLASGGIWTLSGITATVANEVFTATAKVSATAAAATSSKQKSTSYSNCNPTTVGATCADKVINTTFDVSGRGFCAPAGSATPGATIQIKHNGIFRSDAASGSSGGVSGTVTVNPDGGWNWKCNTNSNCGSGGSACGFPTTGVFEITQTVSGGCPSEPLYHCISATISDAPTFDATPSNVATTISGTCGTNASITWYLDDISQGTATFSGSWSFSVSGLIEGEVVRVVAVESGECSNEVSATVVATPVPSAAPTFVGDYCAPSGGSISEVSGVTASGAGTKIDVYSSTTSGSGYTLVGSIPSTTGSSWTLSSITINEGDYVVATATGSGETVSAYSTEIQIQSQTVDASLAITNPATPNEIRRGDASISGTSSLADGATIYLYLDGDIVDGFTGTVSSNAWTITDLNAASVTGYDVLYAGATVTVTSQSGSLCESAHSAGEVVLCQLPDNTMTFAATSATTICAGETIDFSVSTTENLIIYELQDQNENGVGPASLGDGTALSLTTYAIDASVTSISLIASRIGAGTCKETVGTIAVSPEEINLTHVITQQPSNCPSPDGIITLSGLSNGQTYTLDYKVDGIAAATTTPTANGSGEIAISGLGPGEYSDISITGTAITLTCGNVIAGPVVLTNAASPVLTLGSVTMPATCGASTGNMVLTSSITGSVVTYDINYLDDGVFTTKTADSDIFTGEILLTGLDAGLYTNITITPTITECKSNSIGPVTISDPNPTIAVSGSANPSTCGGTGTINFTFTGVADGTTYAINYDGGSFSPVVVNSNTASVPASAGNYLNLNITDATTGCTTDENPDVTLSDPSTHTIAATKTNPTVCGGNGSINLTFTGVANGNYAIDYDGGSFSNVAISSNLATINTGAGTYNNLSLTYLGCLSAEFPDVILTNPTKPTVSLASSSNPTTPGGADGQIKLTITGVPNGSYTLDYEDGAPSAQTFTGVTITSGSATISGLTEGTYNNISITHNSCTSVADIDVVLTDPVIPTPSITSSTPSNPSTCGGTDGSIALTFTDVAAGTYSLDYHDGVGTASFSGVVVDGSGNATISGLSAGTYNDITITVNSKTSVENIDVTLSDPTTATIAEGTHTQPTDCVSPNGAIVLTGVTSGTYDVDFSFNGVAQSTRSITATASGISISGLNNGAYTNLSITNPTTGCESNVVAGPINLANTSAPSGADITTTTTILSTTTTTADLTASATDNSGTSNLTYAWTTGDGTIDSGAATATATVSDPGTYTVTITDPDNGCTTTAQQIITEDVVAPAATISGQPAAVNSTTPYNVTVDFGEVVTGFVIGEVDVANGSATDFTDNGDGTYTVEITPDGTGDITVDVAANVAQDAAGNNNTAATTVTTVYDTTAPATVPTVTALTTNDTTPTISGTATVGAGETLTVEVNSVTYTAGDGNLVDNGDGTWSLTIPAGNALTENTYSVTATVTDAAGNSTSDATSSELVIDTTAPATAPTVTAQTTNDTTPTISGTAAVGAGETLTVTVNGITYTAGDGNLVDNGDGTWSLTIPAGNALTENTYSVTATVTDAAGNSTSDATDGELTIILEGVDTDGDGILDEDEDTDGDGDLANDDCDADGTPNYLDADPCDTDGDGLDDSEEDTDGDGNPYNDDCDQDGTPNFQDADTCDDGTDTDGDGVTDVEEDIDGDGDPTNDDSDGDGTPDYLDTDDDGDGVLTEDEDTDGDGDPTNDDCDADGTPNYLDADPCDTDGDGLDDSEEDTDGDGNPYNDDCDQDGTPNFQDSDSCDTDGDGILDEDEDLDGDGDPTNDDCDADGTPNYLDADPCDSDGDGLNDEEEDTDGDGNPYNDDCDADGTPNFQDADSCDSDGDGILDEDEDLDGDGDPTNDDCDADGTPNYLDADPCDSDGDGLNDAAEDTDGDGNPYNDDCDADGTPNFLDSDSCDTDGDGVLDSDEDVNGDGDPANDDTDGDGIPDYLDTDDDGDGIDTKDEDGDRDGDPTNDDCDGDGTPNYLDTDRCPKVEPRRGFTPDGDGINDFFYIKDIENYPNNTVQIFNRWGNKVFEIKGYDNQNNVWKSDVNSGLRIGNDNNVPSGTYYYLIQLGDGSDPISGFVVVNR